MYVLTYRALAAADSQLQENVRRHVLVCLPPGREGVPGNHVRRGPARPRLPAGKDNELYV